MQSKIICFILVFAVSHSVASSQTLMTKTGFIGFYSKTAFEDIKAENNQVYAVLDPSNLHLAFALLLKGFLFEKELMQEHFNENYVESDKYPKATFSGSCSGDVNLAREGNYPVVIKGNLTIHGITQPVETTANLEVLSDQILGTATFKLKPENFQIQIPEIVRNKIAREMDVRVKTKWPRIK